MLTLRMRKHQYWTDGKSLLYFLSSQKKSSLFWHLLVLMISCERPGFLLLLGFIVYDTSYTGLALKEVDWSFFDQLQYRRTINIALLFMKELMYENLPARREIVTINKVYNQTFYKLIDFRYKMWNVNYNRMYQQRSQSSILHYLMKEKITLLNLNVYQSILIHTSWNRLFYDSWLYLVFLV